MGIVALGMLTLGALFYVAPVVGTGTSLKED